jgi:CDP-glucose 4,6-dehydratase
MPAKKGLTEKYWQEKHVLITGATGFVGTWLAEILTKSGAYVVVLIRDWDPRSDLIRSGIVKELHVVSGILEDYACLERALNEHEVDTVFHLGAQAIVGVANRSPLSTFEANIRGTYNLLEACRVHTKTVKRVIVASSDKAYGDSEVLPYVEAMAPQGRHPYDVSKSCADLLAQAYYHTYRLPVGIARCGNIYGGGDLNWSRIVPGTIRSLIERHPPIIRSDGHFVRDYVYVEDIARAYMDLAQALDREEVHGEAFNFSSEKPLSVLEIVAAIQELMGHRDLEPVILNEATAEIRDQYLSAARARDVLGWKARYTLEEGLAETIQWYRAFLQTAKPPR